MNPLEGITWPRTDTPGTYKVKKNGNILGWVMHSTSHSSFWAYSADQVEWIPVTGTRADATGRLLSALSPSPMLMPPQKPRHTWKEPEHTWTTCTPAAVVMQIPPAVPSDLNSHTRRIMQRCSSSRILGQVGHATA